MDERKEILADDGCLVMVLMAFGTFAIIILAMVILFS